MKKIINWLLPFIFVFIFISSCFLMTRLSNSYLQESKTNYVQNISDLQSPIMMFASEDIFNISSSCLANKACFDEFTKDKSNYSFLVPKGKEEYYKQKLSQGQGFPLSSFEVSQLSDGRQLIKYLSQDVNLESEAHIIWYEAEEKQIYPKKVFNTKDVDKYQGMAVVITGLLAGLVVCVFCYYIYSNFIKQNI